MRHALRQSVRHMRGLPAALALAALLVGGLQPLRAGAATVANPVTLANPVTTATTVVSLLAQGQYAAADRYLAPALKTGAAEGSVQQTWVQLADQIGAYQRLSRVSELRSNDELYVFVRCVFTGGRALLAIRIAPPGSIDGFWTLATQAAGGSPAGVAPRVALVRLLTARPIQSSWFNPGYLAQVNSVARVGQLMAGITAHLGPYTGIAAQSDDVFQVRYRDGICSWFVALDEQGRITWLIFGGYPQLALADLHLPGAQAHDAAARAAAVDALLTLRLQRHQFSGSVLVAVRGKVVLAKGYGYMYLATKRPSTVNTAYRIGAITNQFTALAIHELQEAGKLSVRDRLCRYVQPCPPPGRRSPSRTCSARPPACLTLPT